MWSNDCQKSFNALKQALCEAPVLAYPRFDLPFVLDTDASMTGVTAVLSQIQDSEERPIAYAAKALTKSQRKWAPTKIEMYALVFGTEEFYPYLINKQFVARLDHRSLVWLQNFKQPKPQEARWVEHLQQFYMKIEHRLGRLHANADGLSRRPWPENPTDDTLDEVGTSDTPLIVGPITSNNATTPVQGDNQPEPEEHPPLWSNAHLRIEQPKDKHLNEALQWLEAERRPCKEEMKGANRHMWSLWSQYNRLLLQDGLLYWRWFDEKTGLESLQLCVPQHLKGDVLRELHDQCGHLSVRKTTDNVRKRFYWFGHTADIELYCQSCHVCGSRNGPIPRPRAPMQSIKTGYPLERIQIDILGPLPETNRGNKYVAVVVDMYTKWPEAYALPDQEAETVAQTVMDNFVCRFGCPRGVLSDQGRNFESRTFRGLCSLIESVKQRTTPYHPQCDGGAERLIRTVTSVIAKVADEQKEWDQYLPKVLLVLRASSHETTGFSPSMLMFGRELRLPIDAMRDDPPSERPTDYPSFVKKQGEILQDVKERVEENLKTNLRHQKDVYDARCKGNSRPYRMGDLVWLEEKAVPRWVHRKFYRPWSGPWRVVKVISNITYRIQCEEAPLTRRRRKMRMIVHFNRLKPYHTRPVQLQPQPPDVEVVARLPADLNVGEQAAMGSPETCPAGPLPEDSTPTENATVISHEPDRPLRRSTRSCRAPAWMEDFLSGKDIDNALRPLERGGV